MCTIFRPENVFTTYDQAVELRDLTGLALSELVVFKPQRMVLHEVLARVTADYEVPDAEGASVGSLGINFRRMTQALLRRHLQRRLDWLVGDYAPAREAVARVVANELALAFGREPRSSPQPTRRLDRRGLMSWLGRPLRARSAADDAPAEDRLVARWSVNARSDPMAAAVYGALLRIVSAIRGLHGGLWGTPDLLEPLVSGLACNAYAGDLIAKRAAPLIATAAAAEGFRPLPPQEQPVAMSIKGASGAGKSTMRPMQRSLAKRMGASWGDFALVSPDIFRRDLLDIDSLGAHYKHFGTFTSHELAVVERKLDDYLARKAALRILPHILVDRFRFESFAPDSEEQRQLLARIANRRLLHYIFMITPPEKTVERAWQRGLEVGRYKPVDDLLGHNVDAYRGIQAFFLARAVQPTELNQHYEFLDNDVPLGEIPLTVAFGWNRELNIVDVKCMVDMDRYCRINLSARGPDELYADPESRIVEKNVAFLRTCVRQLPVLNFAHRDTGRIYARYECGRLAWNDAAAIDAIDEPVTLKALRAAAPELFTRAVTAGHADPERYLDAARFLTLGRWGMAMPQHPSA